MRNEIDYTFTKNYYELLDFKRNVDNIYITKQRVKETIKRVCLQTGAEVTEAQLLIEFGLEGDGTKGTFSSLLGWYDYE